MADSHLTGPLISENGFIADAGNFVATLGGFGSGDTVVLHTDVLVSTAEVLALFTTPIVVVPAVAATYNIFMGAIVLLDNTGTAYVDDAGEDLVFQESGSNIALSQASDGDNWDGTADVLAWFPPNGEDATTGNIQGLNADIEITILSGNWITGTSPLKVRTFYRQVTAASMVAIA